MIASKDGPGNVLARLKQISARSNSTLQSVPLKS